MARSVFLATTALESFWDTSRSMVFLSDACMRYSRKGAWQRVSYEVLEDYHLDRQVHSVDYAYIQALYERILPQIGGLLNEIHDTKHSVRYWRILLGYWLTSYIHVLYERYHSIKNALGKYPDLMTIVLAEQDFVIPRDTLDFALLAKDDLYNLQLYSKIFRFFGKSFPLKNYKSSLPVRVPVRIKNILKRIVVMISRQFLRFVPVIARHIYISRKKVFLSLFRATLGRVCIDLDPEEVLQTLPCDDAMRSHLNGVKIEDHEFERLFLSLFPYDMPKVFVEGFSRQSLHASKKYPFRPKVIWTAIGLYWDESFKFWAGACVEDGVILVGMQHGGNYGIDLTHVCENHELTINDKFYSWGWEKESVAIVKPMPATKYIGCKYVGADNCKRGVLLTTVAMPRYSFRYQDFRNIDYLSYIEWQQRFVITLSLELKSLMRVRLFVNDFGWDCRQRWDDFDSAIKLEDWKIKFSDSMEDCRLHVTDHLSSTFLDGLVIGKPTILFWNRKLFKVRPEVEKYMDDLRRVGILYDTPELAADAVNRVYGDVEGWWNDFQRQLVVKKFCFCFARTSPTAVREWAEEINLLVKKGGQRGIG